ncbi:MAG: hypothetical protein IPP49_18090 [Saprospiraceae bacterium]|nr:hypothetical protein [Saprospiraceae bacterium]
MARALDLHLQRSRFDSYPPQKREGDEEQRSMGIRNKKIKKAGTSKEVLAEIKRMKSKRKRYKKPLGFVK